MNKPEGSKIRYFVQWGTHARHMCMLLCSLMEHQSLVDLAICCGTNTIHAHKCILAANSPYFREQLEKNAGTEQVVISGLDFTVIKSIIEFMYCGETNILDENLKYMMAAAKLFQMRGLQALASENQEIRFEADSIHIPAPVFLPKKPKYPNAYRPLNNNVPLANFNAFKAPIPNDSYMHRKIKRKFVRAEAEKACAKEAAASRLALEALQKELANTAQMSSFVIEESCTETTVENFIPHSDEHFIENLNHIESVPLQVVNYADLNSSLLAGSQVLNIDKRETTDNVLQYGVETSATKDKLKHMLGTDIPGNVEIMFRTSDGNFVHVTDDVLQNLSGGTLQYQIVDENGQVGEIRDIEVHEQNNQSTEYDGTKGTPLLDNSLSQECSDVDRFVNNQNKNFVHCSNLELPSLEDSINDSQNNNKINNKLKTVDESQIIDLCSEEKNEDVNNLEANNDFINITDSSSSSSSSGKTIHTNSSPDSKDDETDPFIDTLNKSIEIVNQADDSNTFENCNSVQYLKLNPIVMEDDSNDNIYIDSGQISELPVISYDPNILSKTSILNTQVLTTVTANSDSANPYYEEVTSNSEENCNNFTTTKLLKLNTAAVDIGASGDNILNTYTYNLKDHENKADDCIDYITVPKKTKFGKDDDELEQILDAQNVDVYSPRKTRSSLKVGEHNASQSLLNSCKDLDEESTVCPGKFDKPRRNMLNRKKKL